MTLKTEEKLLEICDLFAAGFSYTACAKSAGVAPRTLFMWLRNSAAGTDPDLIINYMEEPMQFAQAMALARKILHMSVRSALESRSAMGHVEPIFFQGRPSWVEMEEAVGLDEDTRALLGYPRDGLLRDEQGRRVQHVLVHQPPIAAQLRVLEMSFSEEYTPTQNINTINSDTGVARAAPIDGEKIAAPARPPRPVIEDKSPVVDGDFEDLLGPEPGAEGLGTEPVTPATPATGTDPDAPVIVQPIQPGDRASVMIRTPTAANLAPALDPLIRPNVTGRPLSELERDLLSNLPSSLNRKPS
jgi:hypothetical protein